MVSGRWLRHLGLAAGAFTLAALVSGPRQAGALYALRFWALALCGIALTLDLGPNRAPVTNLNHALRSLTFAALLALALRSLYPAADFYFDRRRAAAQVAPSRLIVVRKDLARQAVLLYAPNADRYEWFEPVRADFMILTESKAIEGYVLDEHLLPRDLEPTNGWLWRIMALAYFGLWFAYMPLGLREIFSGWATKFGPKLIILGPTGRGPKATP